MKIKTGLRDISVDDTYLYLNGKPIRLNGVCRHQDYEGIGNALTNEMHEKDLKIVEEIRDESYPIFQDSHGTHIFREKAMESYKEVLEFKDCIDVFIIDGIFKDTKYLVETVSNYSSILNKGSMKLATKISSKYSEDHDSGFLFKKTQYDKF